MTLKELLKDSPYVLLLTEGVSSFYKESYKIYDYYTHDYKSVACLSLYVKNKNGRFMIGGIVPLNNEEAVMARLKDESVYSSEWILERIENNYVVERK